MRLCGICLSVLDSFHFSQCPWGLSMLVKVTKFPSLEWLASCWVSRTHFLQSLIYGNVARLNILTTVQWTDGNIDTLQPGSSAFNPLMISDEEAAKANTPGPCIEWAWLSEWCSLGWGKQLQWPSRAILDLEDVSKHVCFLPSSVYHLSLPVYILSSFLVYPPF